ncbi:MAG: hypothetical protein K6E50_12705 [Lachnospiraceae bacterium]|nr:hypothetical protein [Lachnospiraceae bacterium]
MGKKIALILLAIFLVAGSGAGTWFFMHLRAEELEERLEEEKEDELEELESRFQEERTAEQEAHAKEVTKLTEETSALEEERDRLKDELTDALSRIPAEQTVVIKEDVPRIYQQTHYEQYADRNDEYDTRQYIYSSLYSYPTDVVFVGDSLVARCNWAELYPDLNVKNRGIGADTIIGVRARVQSIIDTQPEKVFLEIGINDILMGRPVDVVVEYYGLLLDEFGMYDCKLYVTSILPVAASQNDSYRILVDTMDVNRQLAEMCEQRGLVFIDLWPAFAGEDQAMRDEFYYDGVHLNATAYKNWKEHIDAYVYE